VVALDIDSHFAYFFRGFGVAEMGVVEARRKSKMEKKEGKEKGGGPYSCLCLIVHGLVKSRRVKEERREGRGKKRKWEGGYSEVFFDVLIPNIMVLVAP